MGQRWVASMGADAGAGDLGGDHMLSGAGGAGGDLVAIMVSGGHLILVIVRASSRGRRDFEASIISRATTPARGPSPAILV